MFNNCCYFSYTVFALNIEVKRYYHFLQWRLEESTQSDNKANTSDYNEVGNADEAGEVDAKV